ncbi:FHA domain-containing protein [Cellvibrio mixtus]|uniref:FHA domain-containing protein n=1 Tax=Cellvibrio mixtus TaxID=39650 RepID=UPI000586900B|nr:FHA domain-containing protein [Cellvibrio mixtus]
MSLPVFVELLTPDGEVIHRNKFIQLPIRIGRAYDNDIILDDPHTAAHHAQIELNQLDELVINDLGSRNGIAQDNQRNDFFVVNGDAVYRLGHTRLRVRTAAYAVADEVSDSTNHGWEGWRPALLGGVLLVTIGLLSTWLSDLQQGTLSKYLLELVSVIGFAIGWAGVWALFSRLFNGHARFGRHLLIVSSGLTVLELWEFFSGAIAYAFSLESLATFTSPPVVVICAFVLYFHLLTTGNKRPQRLKYYLAGLAILGIGITMAKQYQASNHLADELYLSNLYPPALRISSDKSLESFTTNINALKTKVDDERKENPEKGADKNVIEKIIDDSEEEDAATSTESSSSSSAIPAVPST